MGWFTIFINFFVSDDTNLWFIDCGQAYPHLGPREVYRFYANHFDARYLKKDFQLNNRDLRAEHARLTGLLEHKKQDLAQVSRA
jgi:hypothetical protein